MIKMVDYIHTAKPKLRFDDISVEKLVIPITGWEQRYHITATSYADNKEVSFVLSSSEFKKLKTMINKIR